MSSPYVVELQPGCWLAPWSGDPGRTLVLESARRYSTKRGANIALGVARRYRPFATAEVQTLAYARGVAEGVRRSLETEALIQYVGDIEPAGAFTEPMGGED